MLEPFLAATHLPRPDLTSPPHPDLQTLVVDYESYQLSQQLESSRIDHDEAESSVYGAWSSRNLADMLKVELPKHVKLSGVKRTYEGISAANLLTIRVQAVPSRTFDTTTASYGARTVVAQLTPPDTSRS